MSKLYVSDMNYYPGESHIPAGTCFTADQWVEAGGKEDDLNVHIKKGYIKEATQTLPEEPKKEEKKEPKKKKAPDGMWNFDMDQLTELSLEVLNTIAKQKADEFGVSFKKYEDKESLILLMCSQAGQ